jgi:hypothetical protein
MSADSSTYFSAAGRVRAVIDGDVSILLFFPSEIYFVFYAAPTCCAGKLNTTMKLPAPL